nr:hypothetical protein [Aeromonas caviae]
MSTQPLAVGMKASLTKRFGPAEVEVIALRSDKPIATLATRIFTQGGALAVTGEAVVKLP